MPCRVRVVPPRCRPCVPRSGWVPRPRLASWQSPVAPGGALAAVRGRTASAASAASVEEITEPADLADVQLRTEKAAPKEPPREAAISAAPVVVARASVSPPAGPEPPPARPAPAVIPPRVETAVADAPIPAGPDQFLIARQQIDLKLYDQAIESLRKVAAGRRPPEGDRGLVPDRVDSRRARRHAERDEHLHRDRASLSGGFARRRGAGPARGSDAEIETARQGAGRTARR